VKNWFAFSAFIEGNIEGIQKQLDYGRSAWDNVGHDYTIFEAAVSLLKGDLKGVKEVLAPLWKTTNHFSYTIKSWMAAIEGDLDLSLDCYEKALSESEFSALLGIRAPNFISQLFPEYRSHLKHQKMLKDVGLDDESVAKLKIPPLPF